MSTKKTPVDPFDERLVLQNLSLNLSRVLEKKGIEPRPFAIELGVPPQAIYRILNQETTPKVHVVARVAHALGVSIESLVESPK